MCELMSIAATAVFAALAFAAKRSGRPHGALSATALSFAGASLMWSVDCLHSLLGGGPLLDLSAGDAALGAAVVAAGCVLFAALRLREMRAAGAVSPKTGE